jgi:hypothetical protein
MNIIALLDTKPLSTYVDSASGKVFNKGLTAVTYMVIDATTQNSANCSFTVNVNDTTKPILTVPNSVTVSCTDPTDPSSTGFASATDNCDSGWITKAQSVWINEFHYENVGGDVGEFVEVAGLAGTDLSAWQLVLYRGNGTVYNTIPLSLMIPDEGCGFGAVAFNLPTDGIQNGPDGIALVMQPWDQVIQFC